MRLSEFYPSPTKLVPSERNVLRYLMTNTYIVEKQATFGEDAKRYYNRNTDTTGFVFSSYLDVCHSEIPRRRQNPNLRLFISTDIQLKGKEAYSTVSYCLAVCRVRPKYPILRKFHFDVVGDGNDGTRRQQHPLCHLQYCGKMIPSMRDMGCQDEQLKQMHPWLSEPRVFFWPMSLALLVDMALREFPDSDSLRFRQTREWRGIVRNQETLVLKPFYEKCVQITGNAPGNDRILADEFYIS